MSPPAAAQPNKAPQDQEPSLHPLFLALQETLNDPTKVPPRAPKRPLGDPAKAPNNLKQAPQETPTVPKQIRAQDHYAFVLDRSGARERSIWDSVTAWPERVCRLALPDQFESDRTYLRVPGMACPEPLCGAPQGSQAQGLWIGPQGQGPLYVVHGCTRCGQRRLLARDAEVRVVYS